jgi:excisionase family DNA binding protein
MPKKKTTYTVTEAAKALGISKQAVSSAIKSGTFSGTLPA